MKIVVIGAGGHARVILDVLKAQGGHEIIGIIDKNHHPDENLEGVPILCTFDKLPELISKEGVEGAIVAVGDNHIRKNYYNELKKLGLKLVNAIHPSASIASNVELGEGIVICRETIVCVDAKIGNNCILNSGAIIEHQDILEDHVHIAPGVNLAGRVTVKEGSFVGIGSNVIQRITIGKNSIIGAGSIVIEDIPNNVVAVGTPAKVVKEVTEKQEFGEQQVFEIKEN